VQHVPKLLIAGTTEARQRLYELLGQQFELVEASTTKQAFESIQSHRPDGIVCTVLFDESRMLDFLKAAKADPEIAAIPFIACRAIPSYLLPEDLIRSLESVSASLEASMFLDLLRLVEQGKEAETALLIKNCLERKK
jgi:response regulator RpfG family c-di-GMP phosphodiesterase